MVKTSIAVAAAVTTAALGFGLGRWSARAATGERAHETAHSSANEPAAPAAPAPVTPARPATRHPMTRSALTEAMKAADRDASQAEASLPACVQQLRIVRDILKDNETMRTLEAGTPIPARATPPAPRFASTSMTGALQAAFASASVPGSVDGVDCSEYPCIVFGRIRGSEDKMAKLEHSKSMAVYEDDILTVLLWAATDEEAKEAAESRHEADEGLEQSLYAVALYPRTDKQQLGDNLDRRIRSRTAELWNGMSPSDETAAEPGR